ncbi:CueP family metal-binding protein [Leucobacter sp. CSA2]|uniref:CueP family metal-binding protein n=1 Tax=Leucobacter edaphi TaxID=2796472 RepID=A0A934QCG6_9MICO|nr:CueP family metal-binding protein [Leucobacter edaphi]MBK0420532.1 CueP family metal-binding protein [Leucobacter edaphi]
MPQIPEHHTRTGARRLTIAIAATALIGLPLALAGCASAPDAPAESSASGSNSAGGTVAPDALLAPLELDGRATTEVIDALDALPLAERPGDLMASIRPDTLVLTNQAGAEARLPMPEDRFYVSIAPYVEQTHECHFHSLTTCVGELRNAEVSLTVTDASTGENIFAEQRVTADNGFLGLWVPRGPEYEVRIERDGRAAETRIVTDTADAATCLTTMQLTNA